MMYKCYFEGSLSNFIEDYLKIRLLSTIWRVDLGIAHGLRVFVSDALLTE